MGEVTEQTAELYVGVDVGGTNIQAALVLECGRIVAREKISTPRSGTGTDTVAAIEQVIDTLLHEHDLKAGDLEAVGVAVPGVTDPIAGRVIITPNLNLTGIEIAKPLSKRLGIPVALGNDTNMGTLGERWLGAARHATSAFGIFVGTGIGGGFVRKNKLWRGYRESAGEIGHTVIQIGGPKCACGNFGCLEALAGRWAIERDIREAVKAGRTTILTDLLKGSLRQVRSGALGQALAARDPLVTEILTRAAEALGQACVMVFHMVDPETIILGGGVMEACGDFLLPIVRKVVGKHRLPGSREGGEVLLSPLGDDAVIAGAVALARQLVGCSPFNPDCEVLPVYDPIRESAPGEVTVGGETCKRGVAVRVNGDVKKWQWEPADGSGKAAAIRPEDLSRACRGGPEMLFVGTGPSGELTLADESQAYLKHRAIGFEALPTPKAIKAYNGYQGHKAALLHLG
ncbi:MAG: ROK family protein [Planctomycetes bacterium]|nr:ROK family protein [Planctomycetota bacterium]